MPGDRRDGVQVDVPADLRAERPRVERHPRRTGEVGRARARRRAARPARAAGAPSRRAGSRRASTPRSRTSGTDAAERASGPAGDTRSSQPTATAPPRHRRQPVEAEQAGRDVVADARPRSASAGPASVRSGIVERDLAGLGLQRASGAPVGSAARRRGGHLVERGGQVAEVRVLVDVGDGDLGEPSPAAGTPAGPRSGCRRRGRRSRRSGPDVRAEDVAPELRRASAAVPLELPGCRSAARGRAAATAARRGRSCPTCGSGRSSTSRQPRHQRAGSRCAQRRRAPRPVERRRRRRRSRRAAGCPALVRRTAAAAPVTPGSAEQRAVDLAELDPSAAELDLVVGAADEDQTLRVVRGPGRRCGRRAPSPASASRRTSRRPWPGRGSGPGRRRR